MRTFLLTRAFYSIITLWLLTSIVFGLVRLTGDPVKMKAEAGADEAYMAQLRRDWGLDQPLYYQYISFLANLVQGDFGHSFAKSLAVRTIYFERLPNSLKLGLAAFVISMLLGVPLGMLSALKPNTWLDSFGKMFALLGLSMPGFFIGLVLVIIFGVELGWLPVLGKGQSAFVGGTRPPGWHSGFRIGNTSPCRLLPWAGSSLAPCYASPARACWRLSAATISSSCA